jgi:hypothetical protein
MHSISYLLELSISLMLELWLVTLLFKRGVRRHFPMFFYFTLYAAAATAARLLASAHYRTYFYTFWWTEALLLVLSLAALHEVFHWMFVGFYQLWWFRLFYYGAIALVLGIAVRNAVVNPPAQAHRVISLVLNISIAVDLVQAGIVSLFYIFRRLLVVEFRRYAYGIVVGFGITSTGPLLGYLARSEFGTKVETFAVHSAAVAYILGAAAWITTFIRPEPEEEEWLPPMSPERMLEEAQSYLRAVGIAKRKR